MSPSRLLPDDPRLTAYALEELDPTERELLERQLAESPEARAAVDEVRKLAGLLTAELRQEPAPALTAAQRTAILAGGSARSTPALRTAPATPVKVGRSSVARFASLSAIAALVLIVAFVLPPGPEGPDSQNWSRISRESKHSWHDASDWGVAFDESDSIRIRHDVTSLSSSAPTSFATSGAATGAPVAAGGALGTQPAGLGSGGGAGGFAGSRGINLGVPNESLQQQVELGAVLAEKKSKLRSYARPVAGEPVTNGEAAASSASGSTVEAWILAEKAGKRNRPASGDRTARFLSIAEHDADELSEFSRKSGGRGDLLFAESEARAKQRHVLGREGKLDDAPRDRARAAGLEKAPQSLPAAGSTPAHHFYLGNSAGFDAYNKTEGKPADGRADTFGQAVAPFGNGTGFQSDFSYVRDGEAYEPIVENPVLSAYEDPLSTFGVDVDTASYANVRRFLTNNQLPPPNAVRIEELVNYFSYDYPQPSGEHPFSVNIEAGSCPWNPGNRLVRIGLKGKEIARDRRPAGNLIFLVDVSGSMQAENKLPLVKMGLNLLTGQLTENDKVGIVTYSDTAVERLASTNGTNKGQILATVDSLQAAGSTNGSAGIQLAYRAALNNFIDGGTNRVILCTDGDFNVGVTGDDELVKMIQERARTKVFFSVFGFGMGNLKDGKLEKLADKGNGHYAYIDGQNEARKVFVDELAGTLVTIAKDVKLQVEFNPMQVDSYRLIGYENRVLASQDFNDDKKDAGEIGAGHTVTAMYEIVPAGAPPKSEFGDALRYRKTVVAQDGGLSRELLTVKLRYKRPEADASVMFEVPMVVPAARDLAAADANSIETHAVMLRRLPAGATAKSLQNLYSSADRESRPSIEADEAGHRLLLRGSPSEIWEIKRVLADLGEFETTASHDFNWSAAVAAFGMMLRNSQFRGQANFDMVLELAQGAKGEDKDGRRTEFIGLVQAARALATPVAPLAASTAPLSREQAEARATVEGKYKNLLRIVPAEGDAQNYGPFHEFGLWQGTSYAGLQDLPQGYWVYVAPNWYIWGDVAK